MNNSTRLEKLKLPSSFCFAPYTNLDLDQDGTWLPCFRSEEAQGSWKEHDITETFNSSNIQAVRTELWKGKWPKNCEQCQAREQEGIKSTRQEYNEHLLELADNLDFVEDIKKAPQYSGIENIHTLEIRPHNLCNLACGHCDPHSSSRWVKIKSNETKNQDFTKHLIDNPEYLKKFYTKAGKLKTVHFTGGEPLIYASSHKEWLNGIQNKHNIELRYHSNLNHNQLSTYQQEWDKFKHVKFFASIDTSQRYYEFFRFGSKWDRVDYNIDYLLKQKHEVVGTITVNFFTMLDLVGLVKYLVAKNLQIHVAFVDAPGSLNIAYMSNEQKNKAIEQIAQAKLEINYKEEWKEQRGYIALDKITEFIKGTWEVDKEKTRGDLTWRSDKQHPKQLAKLEYLDKTYQKHGFKSTWTAL